MSMRIVTLIIMSKIFIRAPKILRKMAMASILDSLTILNSLHVFCILRRVVNWKTQPFKTHLPWRKEYHVLPAQRLMARCMVWYKFLNLLRLHGWCCVRGWKNLWWWYALSSLSMIDQCKKIKNKMKNLPMKFVSPCTLEVPMLCGWSCFPIPVLL